MYRAGCVTRACNLSTGRWRCGDYKFRPALAKGQETLSQNNKRKNKNDIHMALNTEQEVINLETDSPPWYNGISLQPEGTLEYCIQLLSG